MIDTESGASAVVAPFPALTELCIAVADGGSGPFSLTNLPEIGDKVRYKCEAGGHNKIRGDFSKNYFDILCEDNNKMQAPATWPVCMAGKGWVYQLL